MVGESLLFCFFVLRSRHVLVDLWRPRQHRRDLLTRIHSQLEKATPTIGVDFPEGGRKPAMYHMTGTAFIIIKPKILYLTPRYQFLKLLHHGYLFGFQAVQFGGVERGPVGDKKRGECFGKIIFFGEIKFGYLQAAIFV